MRFNYTGVSIQEEVVDELIVRINRMSYLELWNILRYSSLTMPYEPMKVAADKLQKTLKECWELAEEEVERFDDDEPVYEEDEE